VEGLVDHQILGIHHVLPGNPHQFLFDMLFLATGFLLCIIGFCLIRPPGVVGHRQVDGTTFLA
jgi:uncharacterized membrane protein